MSNKTQITDNLIDNESFQKYVLFEDKPDVKYWEKWLLENPTRKKDFIETKKVLTSFKIKAIKIDPEKFEIDLKKLQIALDKNRKKKATYLKVNFQKVLKYAAIIVISVGIGFSVSKFSTIKANNNVTSNVLEKSNPKGQKSIIMLPDGSTAYLNSASSLLFESDPITGSRNVYLSGEAFFKVAKDKNSPFIVHSNGIKTTALGTSFNVNAYSDEENVEVYLKTGKVEVESNNSFFLLNPNEGVTFNHSTNQFSQTKMEERKVLGWKDEVLILNNENLTEVTRKLEKWYGITIYTEGNPSENWRVNGEFEGENIQNILESLSIISSFNYEIDGEIVTLKFKNN
jgi:ferric-dicitrate binding protein FerR (iron transport regulator)